MDTQTAPEIALEQVKELMTRARREAHKVIIGQDDVIDKCLIVIFTNQHALIEGAPGVAKTLLVRTLARLLGCEFNRIQFTPDLMPADITGTNIFDMQRREFALMKGPIFTSFLLADEINRAPAKTQSALLQAMQERKVTIDRETHELSPNFTVFATQNPIEYEGTYPLPEAQKDRFMLKIIMGYPEANHELELARRTLGRDAPERSLDSGTIEPLLTEGAVVQCRRALESVVVREELMNYVVEIVRRTRGQDSILVGAGPRATQALLLGARAHAALEGRDFVSPDDIRELAVAALGHRIALRPEYEIEGLTVEEALRKIVETVAVPR